MKQNMWLIVLLVWAMACREKFVPPFEPPAAGYLVVEGNINSGDTTIIQLSRSNTLSSQAIVPEQFATLRVEGTDNSVHSFSTLPGGRYRAVLPPLNPAQQYRLRILTRDGTEYLSEYAPLKITPAIDSISWARERDNGVQIYVNAHDDNNASQYYLWQYQETWEFKSAFLPDLAFKTPTPNRVIVDTTTPDLSIYTCWNGRASNQILVSTTVNLTKDRVLYPIKFVPRQSREMSVLYSINVQQYTLSKEAYEFYEKLKKNTETTGSIFDAQPSEIAGNIKCLTRPSEPVIGFINVSSVTQKRKFIYNSELPGWNYRQSCATSDFPNNPDSVQYAYNAGGVAITTTESTPSGGIARFLVTFNRACVDCRLTGTNVKPPFWP